MIPIPSGARVWLVTDQYGYAQGMDGLALIVRETLKRDPHSGPSLCFPRPSKLSGQMLLERRPRAVPVLEAIGARAVSMAFLG